MVEADGAGAAGDGLGGAYGLGSSFRGFHIGYTRANLYVLTGFLTQVRLQESPANGQDGKA